MNTEHADLLGFKTGKPSENREKKYRGGDDHRRYEKRERKEDE